jgi:DNA-binding IclR family transcriptional regulator
LLKWLLYDIRMLSYAVLSIRDESMSSNAILNETPGAATGKSVPAVRRAAAILWHLAGRSDALSLSEIARAAEILPSTALHILRELSAARLIATDPDQKLYRLGSGLVDLAQAVILQNNFAEIAKPLLHAVAVRFDVTATATAALDADHTACVASVSPPNDMSLNVIVGGRVPRLSGAAGRCIAAYSDKPESEIRAHFDRIRWQAPLDFDIWRLQVDQVRERGYAEDDGYFARGVTTLAAPVFSINGSVTRAVGIAFISAARDTKSRPAIGAALIEIANEISRRLRL